MEKKNIILESKNISLRILKEDDATIEYLNWLRDPEVNKHLEVRFNLPNNQEDLRKHVSESFIKKNTFLFGIFDKSSLKHIGNIQLVTDKNHNHGEIGLLIGNKNFWGKGLGSESIASVTNFAVKILKLRKLIAGAYSSNLSSIKSFKKNGYSIQGNLTNYYRDIDHFVDKVILGFENHD